MEKERAILKGMRGTCPFCDGEDYHRDNFVSDGDHCGDYLFCGETFQETFFLAYQDWEADG